MSACLSQTNLTGVIILLCLLLAISVVINMFQSGIIEQLDHFIERMKNET